jgi:hypothetical protein
MKFFTLLILIVFCSPVRAQSFDKNSFTGFHPEKYFSFNPLALAEPQMTIGLGAGNRFSARSEYFAELSYLFQSPIFREWNNNINGVRGIIQYRYHLLRPRRLFERWRRSVPTTTDGEETWIAMEGRLRHYTFTGTNAFINEAAADTLFNYMYTARANVLGGAILFGKTFTTSPSGRWRLEMSFGIGAKQKFVRFKNIPPGYQLTELASAEWGFFPKIYSAGITPYLPFALRVRYQLVKTKVG